MASDVREECHMTLENYSPTTKHIESLRSAVDNLFWKKISRDQ
jgi:hypothetical protein